MNGDISHDKTCKTCKCNKGVSCDVTNCVYHDGESHCTAERINVGPTYATSCTDTVSKVSACVVCSAISTR